MKDVYFISGLGADERIFQYLRLEGVRMHFVKWIRPLPEDTMASYAGRLLTQIPTPYPVIVGMSMGGMIAVEMSKQIPVEKIILLSSAKTKDEIPWYFQLLRVFRIHQWLPYGLLTRLGILLGDWLFGTSNKAEKRLLHEIIYDTDETFFRWAWEQVIRWQNDYVPPPVFHIHGDRDHMLPIRFIRADRVIQGGTHFMTVTRAEEISALLQEQVSGPACI